MKKIITGSIVLCLGVLAIFLSSSDKSNPNNVRIDMSMSGHDTRDKLELVPYRTDVQPLVDRFPDIKDIDKCYWKADTIGNTDFGPTNYYMYAFIVLKKSKFQEIKDSYKWEKVKVNFGKGLDPVITEYKEFDWRDNEEFEDKIVGNGFIGSACIDLKNGIIFIEVENN